MELNILTVKILLEDELTRGEPFRNRHGITPQNIHAFLVEPFPVLTEPDDLETQTRTMWVVLQECAEPTEGYVIVYDPHSETWNFAEHLNDDHYKRTVGG